MSDQVKLAKKPAPHSPQALQVAHQQPRSSEAIKHDDNKPEYHLIPEEALTAVGAVLRHGAGKYGAHNWRRGMNWSRLFNATLRHLWAWWGGEDLDPETGLPHLAHALCSVMFLLAYQRAGETIKAGEQTRCSPGVDDRFVFQEEGMA